MRRPIAALSGPLVCVILLMPLAPPVGAAALPASLGSAPAVSVQPVSCMPVAVSRSGRYVVLPVNGRLELRDLVRDRVVKRFPTKPPATAGT